MYVLEAWHIRTMNHDAGPLPSEYNPLIHQDQLLSDHFNITACFWHIVHVLTLLLLLFYYFFYLTSSHLCHQFPLFLCIKTPASFCTFFSHWWGPRIGSKHLNQVASTSSCEFWLVKFPIIIILVDASHFTVGAVQQMASVWSQISTFHRSCIQQRDGIALFDRELLAIYLAICHFFKIVQTTWTKKTGR